MIVLELNTNDSEALLNHCRTYVPISGDVREDSRLTDALEELADAVVVHLNSRHEGLVRCERS